MGFRWRIYYADGTTYEGPAWLAPARGVILIITTDKDNGWYVRYRADFYWYLPEEDTWVGGDQWGMYDYMADVGPRRVLWGRMIPEDRFNAIVAKATNDPSLPSKTAWKPNEARPR